MTSPVSATAEQRLREAMKRLLDGEPLRTDGRLTKNNLWREAGVSRATMNRAVEILAEWDARVSHSRAGTAPRQRDNELLNLRNSLRTSRQERRRLQDQVDAAATVIATLMAENAALRRRAANASAVVLPLSRSPTARA